MKAHASPASPAVADAKELPDLEEKPTLFLELEGVSECAPAALRTRAAAPFCSPFERTPPDTASERPSP